MQASAFKTVAGAHAPALPAKLSAVLGPCACPRVAKQGETSTSTRSGATEDIYIGFPKNDYEPREGRKGRVVKDDPRRYPARDDLLTGGWAGGEAGLWKFRDAIKEELKQQKEASPAPKPNGKPAPGKNAIYLGFGKDELELKNLGGPGRVIYDDASKYPDKENVGFLAGATGGFAGGERGVKGFVETGEVVLRKPGQPGGQPISPLTIATICLLGGGLGGVLLTSVFDAGEGLVRDDIVLAPIDDNTKMLLLGAVALLGTAGLIGGARVAIGSVQERMQDAAKNLVTIGGFGLVVFLAARAVLELN